MGKEWTQNLALVLFLCEWPWAKHVKSQRLSYLICEMEIRMTSFAWLFCRF